MTSGRVILDLRRAGIGDAVLYSWIAEGARAAGWDVRFTTGRNDSVFKMFGQTITPEVGVRELGLKGIGERTYGIGLVPWGRSIQASLPFNETPRRPRATIPDEAVEWAWSVVCRERAADEDGPLVLLFPGACYACRTWPLNYWIRLGWALRGAGFNVVTLDSDRKRLGAFPYQVIPESIERMAALIDVADMVVCNESGPAHFAGTLNRRALVLCGPSDPVTTMGLYESVKCVRVSSEVVPCVGCHWRRPYSAACDVGCEALHALNWRDVFAAVCHELQTVELSEREFAFAEGSD